MIKYKTLILTDDFNSLENWKKSKSILDQSRIIWLEEKNTSKEFQNDLSELISMNYIETIYLFTMNEKIISETYYVACQLHLLSDVYLVSKEFIPYSKPFDSYWYLDLNQWYKKQSCRIL